MRFIADLHIHSKYSRAVSKNMTLPELDRWADDKGIRVMGTGDFTHPDWIENIKSELAPAEPGLFCLKKDLQLPTIKNATADTRFMLTVEISCIYKKGGKSHRLHHLIFSPDIETAEKINRRLSAIGNIRSDGRPILGLDSEELLKIVLDANPEAVLIPAHAWTPWFSVFGSMSGFDSLEECFGENAKYIFAVETGLSSDPAMNARLSALDNIALISNSDSHSLERIGREANVFNTELSYTGIIGAIKKNAPPEFEKTIEFFPEEGKYHVDGHRACGISWTPEKTKQEGGICPVCGRKVTVGVLHRVDDLADRKDCEFKRPVPFVNMVPLDQIIGEALGVGPSSKSVKKEYDALIRQFGKELTILLGTPIKDIVDVHPRIGEGVRRVREGNLDIEPGFDGEYGKVRIFKEDEWGTMEPQRALF